MAAPFFYSQKEKNFNKLNRQNISALHKNT